MVGARVDVELATPAEPGDAAAVGCALAPGRWFDAASARPRPRPAHAVWAATDPRGYGGAHARGRAHVHLGRGNTALTRPVVLADGLGHGPADHPVAALTGDGPLDALLDSGRDLVLVGFAERHTHVQANAGVLLDVLDQVRREARGPLVVGGVGVGGLMARYALSLLEHEGADHAAAAYLSVDTPHDGAWAPLVLQQLAYYFERFPAGAATAELLRGPAAQQVFAAWVRDAKYSGPVAAPLRRAFLADLRRVGDFPRRPRLIGLSSGRGDGTGPELTAGAPAFAWSLGGLARAVVRFQPSGGTDAPIGVVSALSELRRLTTTGVPAYDTAPGGTAEFFGQAADALGAAIPDAHRATCFVPSTSAAALGDDDPHTPVGDRTGPFHAFRCASTNLPHGRLDDAQVSWLLDELP